MALGDQADGEAEEGFVDVVASFPADAQASEAVQPRNGAFDDPAEGAQAGAVWLAAFGDRRANASLAQKWWGSGCHRIDGRGAQYPTVGAQCGAQGRCDRDGADARQTACPPSWRSATTPSSSTPATPSPSSACGPCTSCSPGCSTASTASARVALILAFIGVNLILQASHELCSSSIPEIP
ncbi:hypothetical protein J2S50_003730 [Streptomyces sp. DSM 40167]|nr:hypothetical protein [Streptomyces sp. DSM 40167]